MKIYESNDIQPNETRAITTIGTFDGVHRGHSQVLNTIVAWAKEVDGSAGVVTFRQHPRKTIERRAPDLVTTLEHRLALFERAGIQHTWILDFTPELSKQTAREFAQKYFVKQLHIHGLVMGFDTRFGSDRMSKDSPALEPLAHELGFQVRSVPQICSANGEQISSTRIREAIVEGRLTDAESMLGRPVSVYGTVIHGDARGRRLGYSTANLDLGREVRPPFGVYATLALVEGLKLGSITNVGYRPTVTHFEPSKENSENQEKPDLLIETHLFDYNADLYGRKIEVLFIKKLRDERRFPDVAELVNQIKKDEARGREILEKYLNP